MKTDLFKGTECNLCGDSPEYCECDYNSDDDWEDEDYCDECGEHYDDCYFHLGFNDD